MSVQLHLKPPCDLHFNKMEKEGVVNTTLYKKKKKLPEDKVTLLSMFSAVCHLLYVTCHIVVHFSFYYFEDRATEGRSKKIENSQGLLNIR